jgi:hypothetical protein
MAGYEPPPVLARSLMYLALVGGCQTKGRDAPEPGPAVIEVRDDKGAVVASVRPGRPCRATIGTTEMIVGGPPLVSQSTQSRWAGEDHGNGTTLVRDGVAVARLYDKDRDYDVFDPQGIALVRVVATEGAATVADAGSRLLRGVTSQAGALATDSPKLVVTGTRDVKLAAVLSAPELSPEVRALAACERLLAGRP